MHRPLALFLLSVVLLPTAQAQAPARYRLLDLGTLGGKNCYAFALNDRGQVVGSSQTASGVFHAFLWEKGQAVGVSDKYDRPQYGVPFHDPFARPVAWEDGVIRKLSADDGGGPAGINDAGHVIETVTGEKSRTALFFNDGKRVDLGGFSGGYSQATAINNKDEVAETSFTARDQSGHTCDCGFLWADGRMRNLGLTEADRVDALNEREQVVGTACVNPTSPPQKQHSEAFLWQNGKTRFLGRLPGSRGESVARSINELGQIVGWSQTKAGDGEAVLWQDGKTVNLNQRAPVPDGWTLDEAEAVNDRGQILCRGYTNTDSFRSHSRVVNSDDTLEGIVRHAFLLTPLSNPRSPQSGSLSRPTRSA